MLYSVQIRLNKNCSQRFQGFIPAAQSFGREMCVADCEYSPIIKSIEDGCGNFSQTY